MVHEPSKGGGSAQVRILVVDDHQLVRRGLTAFLESEPGFSAAGEASDGAEAVRLYRELRPDAVLLDLQMEPVDGFTALREIRALDPEARVVILTSFVDAAHVVPAIEGGASGYILKTADPEEIVAAVESALRGRAVFDEAALRTFASVAGAAHSALTDREREVLRLIARGKNNQEIGEALFIGLKTVKTHVSNILSKLGVDDRTQAAVYALRNGLCD